MAGDWRALNLANWEARVPVHLGLDGYDLAGFADPEFLSTVVRFDRPRLGDITGLDVVHLQCHIGTDTVSLARLGARSVTGLDFSPSAVAAATDLAQRIGVDAAFVVSDIYDAAGFLGTGCCDLVYTGIGALCWLPDIRQWATVVADLLRPGGRVFLREGHPMLDTLSDDRDDDLLVVHYPYFETAGTPFSDDSTYGGQGSVSAPRGVSFNHGIGEVFTALTEAGLTVTALDEHREVPWKALGDAMIDSTEFDGEYVLARNPERLPLTYTIAARKSQAG
ncbi:class I SAM-dependent methyltransferase [Mycolicibacterium tokaiense]|uniref:Type 11 methyltransferase n=1 Tax=Mycolicibacterium tokaiense TaxID=39695 RepID=A0A378T741_9MYCO|nr:class I SAM-dependent methyltransferase [Mycolicibacterium tokaiense]BBY88880.1 methyltransferase [Mycolicibacterium tokaiense]STZ56599.1 type 11 methyltransferase [Mycolicibacterium tokaiense]